MSTPSPLLKPILERIPIIGPFLRSNVYLDTFTPEAKSKLRTDYRNALGLGDKATFSDTAFDTYTTSVVRDINKFDKTVCADGKNLLEKLNALPDKNQSKAFKTTIKTSLEAKPELNTAQEKFKEDVALFQELKKLIPTSLKAEALVGLMNELSEDAINAIEKQHEVEKAALDASFTDENFKKTLLELGNGVEEEAEVIKTNMKKSLEESQKKNLDEFKKSTTQSQNVLYDAMAAQNKELIFIANLHKNSNETRAEIEKLIKNKNGPRATSVVIGLKPPNVAELAGIGIKDLPLITSITGSKIHQENGVFSIHFDNSILDFLYNQDPRQKHLTDMTLLAEAVRASGYDTVTLDVNFSPDDIALERARQAYEGAINAGFPKHGPKPDDKDKKPKDNIIINVGGKTMRAEELFKGHEGRLQHINAKANKIQEELKELEKKPVLKDVKEATSQARVKLQELKDEAVKKKSQQTVTPVTDSPNLGI